jgi:hypothetical protein
MPSFDWAWSGYPSSIRATELLLLRCSSERGSQADEHTKASLQLRQACVCRLR